MRTRRGFSPLGMVKVQSYDLFLAFLVHLEETGVMAIHCDSPDGVTWRREFLVNGRVVAWENKLTTEMVKVPWKDRVKGDHVYADKDVYKEWVRIRSIGRPLCWKYLKAHRSML